MIVHFGLDIGSETIKVAQVEKDGTAVRLKALGIAKTPPGGVLSEVEKDLVAVAEVIKKLKKDAKISSDEVVASISERKVFTQFLELPPMTESELASAIPWEAENLIPYPLSDVNLDWEIIKDGKEQGDKIKVLLVAVPSSVVNKYLQVIKFAGLQPIVLESESIAVARALSPMIGQKDLIILNAGTKSSELSILSNGELFTTSSLPFSGEAISRAISSSLNLDFPAAEQYKKNYGLSSQLEGKIMTVIEPILGATVIDIQKAIRFLEEKKQKSINLVVLTGGTSLLPQISEYLAKALGIEVQIANPLSFLTNNGQAVNVENPPLFTVAIGLALKEV